MNGINIAFDNNDKRIKHYELLLEGSLDSICEYPLPDGYYFEFYQDGDRDTWIEIEKSAKEFLDYDEGLRVLLDIVVWSDICVLLGSV